MKSTLKQNSFCYLTRRRRINPEVLCKIESLSKRSFQIPKDLHSKEFISKFWMERKEERRAERKGSYVNHQNHASRLKLNLAERLYVPEDDQLPGKSITDNIDRDFYSLVTGRCIKMNKKLGTYLQDIRNCFLTKLKTGYCEDEVTKADELQKREWDKYQEIKREFDAYLHSFEQLLKTDYSSSLDLLKRAESEKKISEEKGVKISDLADSLKNLESELLIIEEKWSLYRTYQKFLYNISPSEWRREHDNHFETERSVISPNDIIQSSTQCDDENLSAKIAKFVAVSSNSHPPALYFQDPSQVKHIFRELEKTNVIALAQCDNLEKPTQSMISALKRVKLNLERNVGELQEEVADLKSLVEEEEAKEEGLRQMAWSIVFGIYKDLVINEDNLNVTALVEDAYEDAITSNDYDLTIVDMMREIENHYESLLSELDRQPRQVVIPALRRFYRDEMTTEKEAKEAERKVHLMDVLLKRLSRSLKYPKKGVRRSAVRKLVYRSEPTTEELKKYDQLKVLTKEEKDSEYFFGKTSRNVGEAGLYRPLCLLSKTLFPKLPA